MRSRKAQPEDPGLQLIDNYERAIVESHMERVRTGGHAPAVIEEERAAVERLAARIGDALRADYRSRSQTT